VRRLLWTVALAAVTAGTAAAAGEVTQLDGPDGTVYLTNAPTDPRYRRMGIAPPPPAPPARSGGAPAGAARSPASLGAQLRDGAIGAQIRDAAGRYGLPEELVTAVIRVESGFNPRAVSRKGAQGLMQLMPATASQLGVRDVFDTAENIEGGVRHLRGLIERFENNLSLALAAYNAGERAVLQYGGIPPYPETQQYVARILSIVGDGAELSEDLARTPTYRFVEEDGATVYTNIARRPR
jgi:soluble lytic murein transglycosylase-like protein